MGHHTRHTTLPTHITPSPPSSSTPAYHQNCKIPQWILNRHKESNYLTKACSNIVDLIESYSHLLDISSGLLSLNIASVINEHNQPTKENEKKFSLKLLKSLCGIEKLPTTAAGALRLYINS